MTTLKDTSEKAEFLAETYALDFPGKNSKTSAKDVFQEIEIKYSTIPHSFLNLNQLETMIYNERKNAFR